MVKKIEDGYGIVFHNEYDSIQTIVMLDRAWEKGPTIRESEEIDIIRAEVKKIESRAMNEVGQDICEYLLSFLSSIEEKSEKLSAERDKDMIESIEMWLHECLPKYVEKELAWLDELRTRLLEEEPEKPVNPEDAMKELDEKIALVKQRGTWDGVDVDKYMDEMRGREPEKPMNQDEELNEEIKRFAAEYDYERSEDILLIAIVAHHFAKWGAEHLKK